MGFHVWSSSLYVCHLVKINNQMKEICKVLTSLLLQYGSKHILNASLIVTDGTQASASLGLGFYILFGCMHGKAARPGLLCWLLGNITMGFCIFSPSSLLLSTSVTN